MFNKIRDLRAKINSLIPLGMERRSLFEILKYSYQRATKGYCDIDLYSLTDWYLFVIRNSLKEFNEIYKSTPSHLTSEEWDKIIEDIYNLIAINKEKELSVKEQLKHHKQITKGLHKLVDNFWDLWT